MLRERDVIDRTLNVFSSQRKTDVKVEPERDGRGLKTRENVGESLRILTPPPLLSPSRFG
jgi:hypothetical protein